MNLSRTLVRLLPLVLLATSCARVPPKPAQNEDVPHPVAQAPERRPSERLRGEASWYGRGFQGRRTASGERFDMYRLTAAHRTLPLGTRVRVTNLSNGRQVVVRITDRGPYADGRVLDVSWAAARKLGMLADGTAPVRIEPIP